MIRIITLNLNGIRSAHRKGFFDWVRQQQADIICLQELRAQEVELQDPKFHLEGYHSYFHYAQKKGYSGVAIYSRYPSQRTLVGLGFEHADHEGRHVSIDLNGLCISSLYMPSGTSGSHRQAVKFDFLNQYDQYLKRLQKDGCEYIICGDLNIAHKPIDLKNWRSNQKNSGFLPEERAWMDRLFDESGFVDAFRVIDQSADQYTWWSNRGRSWEKNVGWRIDYQITTPGLVSAIASAQIYKDQRFSDHAPLLIEYNLMI